MVRLKREKKAAPGRAAEAVEYLRQVYPSVVADGRVDLEALGRELGSYAAAPDECFSFTWQGKRDARRMSETPSTGTLRPRPGDSLDWGSTKNIVVEGDNLEVLKLLQKSYRGRVKMIYIDPPYNTGNRYIYHDTYRDASWLDMMYPRLRLARELLEEAGSIWISIDDHEAANLRQLCDEIFGAENFVATFIWQKRTTRENRRVFSFNHDYVICYAKNKELFQAGRNLLPYGKEALARYTNPDDDPRGPWQSVSLNAQAGHATKAQFYPLTTPSGRVVEAPPGRCWAVTKARMAELIADHRVSFGATGANVPRRKVFLSESKDGLTPHTLWTADEVGTNDSAKKALIRLFDGAEVYDTPKPVALIRRIIHIASDPGDLVLDFFAGSGTTGEAVWREHEAGAAPRRFILVQLPEAIEHSTYGTIAEVTRARLRAAARAVREGARAGEANTSDLGFRAFELASSHIETSHAGPFDAGRFESVDSVRADRTEDDLFFDV